jgi:hypothetical protein
VALPLVEHESTELPLDRFPLGDLGHLISFVRGFEHVPNLFGTLVRKMDPGPFGLIDFGV